MMFQQARLDGSRMRERCESQRVQRARAIDERAEDVLADVIDERGEP
jgi:hypothetical protein